MRVLGPHVPLVIPDAVCNGEEHSNHNAQEGKRADTLVPAAGPLENDGVGGEKHVQGSINDGHVQRQQEDDGLAE